MNLKQVALDIDSYKKSKFEYDRLIIAFNNFADSARKEAPQRDMKYINQLLDIIEDNLNNFLI